MQVFADHESGEHPIDVPKVWISSLPKRSLHCGMTANTIFRGEEIDYGGLSGNFNFGFYLTILEFLFVTSIIRCNSGGDSILFFERYVASNYSPTQ